MSPDDATDIELQEFERTAEFEGAAFGTSVSFIVVDMLLSTHDPEEFATRIAASVAFAFIFKGAFGPDRLADAWTRSRT